MGLRVSVYPYIVHRLGNGKDIFTWFDNWHSLSPLLDHFGGRILDDNASPRNAKLESFIRGSSWNWPNATSHTLLEFI